MIRKPFTLTIVVLSFVTLMNISTNRLMAQELYGFTMTTIDGRERSLMDYKGNVLLIVNVASQCGFTPQYADLEKLFREYHDRGFMILAFPANNFGEQEPGTNNEIREFCTNNYGVTFDLFSKISVLGRDQHPLYSYLTSEKGGFPGEVRWNFEKFLVGRNGKLVGRYRSAVKPFDARIIKTLEEELSR
jgi:glutathione peroxidase